jgi:ribosomal subunit interface protein
MLDLMQIQITFRDMPASEALDALVRERAEKLNKLTPDVISCHVTIDAPHRHQQKGRTFHVTIDLVLRNGEIPVSRDPARDDSHEDAYHAVRDAFDKMTRRVLDHVARQRDLRHSSR